MATAPERSATAEAVLRAAEEEIAENGIAQVSLRAIARRAGVSHQAPGFLYGDRKGLLTALAADGFSALGTTMQDLLDELGEDADATERVGAIGVAYVTFAERHPARFSVMMRPEMHHADDPALQAAQVQSFGTLLGALEHAQATGWGADQPLDSLSMTCWAMVHGIVTLARDGALGSMFPGVSAEEAAQRVTGVMGAAFPTGRTT